MGLTSCPLAPTATQSFLGDSCVGGELRPWLEFIFSELSFDSVCPRGLKLSWKLRKNLLVLFRGVFVGVLQSSYVGYHISPLSHASFTSHGFQHEANTVLFCDYCDISRRYSVYLT